MQWCRSTAYDLMVDGTTITALVQLYMYTSLVSSPAKARGISEVLMGGHFISATAAPLELWVQPTTGVDRGNAGTDHGRPLRTLAAAQQRLADGEQLVDVQRFVLTAALASPRFLFRVEPADEGELDAAAFASRLSYFLWASAPDEALLQADSGRAATQRSWLDPDHDHSARRRPQ